MAIFEDGTRIRLTKPADFYSYDEATKPEGKLAEGTEGTVNTGESFRGRVCIMTTDGISAWNRLMLSPLKRRATCFYSLFSHLTIYEPMMSTCC